MGLFRVSIKVRIGIVGCPERGIAALDWRRERGLSERLDNRADVELDGDISESDYRALIDAGWGYDTYGDGSSCVARNSLRQEFDPVSSYGYRAMVAVRPEHSPVELACLALRWCARQQRRCDLGITDIEREIARLTIQLDKSRAANVELENELNRLQARLVEEMAAEAQG